MTAIRILVLATLAWTIALPALAQSGRSRVLTCHVNDERAPRSKTKVRCQGKDKDTTLEKLYEHGWHLIQVVPGKTGGRTSYTLYLEIPR